MSKMSNQYVREMEANGGVHPSEEFDDRDAESPRTIRRVRVDTLRHGQKFRCVSGRIWIFDRKHGAHSGAYIVHGENGGENCFAGCAIVEVEE